MNLNLNLKSLPGNGLCTPLVNCDPLGRQMLTPTGDYRNLINADKGIVDSGVCEGRGMRDSCRKLAQVKEVIVVLT